jgi:hypothetical protein
LACFGYFFQTLGEILFNYLVTLVLSNTNTNN